MSKITDKIETISKLYHVTGCSVDQINDAQKLLNLKFPEDYTDYVKEYGAISFYRTEWSGLNVTGYLNVVDSTLQERQLNPDFPDDCFVIENLGIDGKIVVENEVAQIYLIHYDEKVFLCDGLAEYLDICIARNLN